MRLISLNMKMFNLVQDNDFSSVQDNDFSLFIKEYKPDIIVIQECRSTKIMKFLKPDYPLNNYCAIFPHTFKYDEDKSKSNVNGTHYYNVILLNKKYQHEQAIPETEDFYIYNRCINRIKINKKVDFKNKGDLLGIHLPLDKKVSGPLFKYIEETKCDIICGDFNASFKNAETKKTKNVILYSNLFKINSERKFKFTDLWQLGLKEKKSFYINFLGNEIEATATKHKNLKTSFYNTHIDYILANTEKISLEKIVIDLRTLTFTDHCALILDYNFKS